MQERRRLRPRDHSKPEVRKALETILGWGGWGLVKGGHWGLLVCDAGCHRIPVSGTPENAGRHARRLLRDASTCPLPAADPRSKKRPAEDSGADSG